MTAWQAAVKRTLRQPSYLRLALTKWLLSPERSQVGRVVGGLGAHPDFMIIGTQKGGSTSLYRYLTDHPQVRSAALKEIHYFSHHYDLPETWYRAHFTPSYLRGARAVQTGEASVSYLFVPAAAGRVAAFKPDLKLVVMLRNPVARAFSHYQMSVKQGYETLSFAEAVAREPERLQREKDRFGAAAFEHGQSHRIHSYLLRGHYAEQLARWLEHFPREQLLILSSEAFFGCPAAAFHETLDFLELPKLDLPVYRQLNKGRRNHATLSAELKEQLGAYFAPHNAKLEKLLGRDLWSEPRADSGRNPSSTRPMRAAEGVATLAGAATTPKRGYKKESTQAEVALADLQAHANTKRLQNSARAPHTRILRLRSKPARAKGPSRP